MRSPISKLFQLTALILILGSYGCRTHTNVMVRAWAQDNYRMEKEESGLPKQEKYAIYRGQFDPGSVRDDSLLGKKQFLEIAKYLQKSLLAQNYVLVKAGETPDLVIVVHWGQTTIDSETIYIDNIDQEGFINSTVFEQITRESLRRNAIILGTAEKIYKSGGSRFDQQEAYENTVDERYYFACIAYDFQDILNKKKTVRWVTQFSVPTTGTDYLDALPSMMRVAANYFGTKTHELKFNQTRLGEGEVIIGEIEVIGMEN